MAIDSTIPTIMKTLDCILGFSLIAARPAAPTKPRPKPAPSAARPKAMPAAINLNELDSVAAGSGVESCAKAAGFAAIKPANAIAVRTVKTAVRFSCISIKVQHLKGIFNGNYTAG